MKGTDSKALNQTKAPIKIAGEEDDKSPNQLLNASGQFTVLFRVMKINNPIPNGIRIKLGSGKSPKRFKRFPLKKVTTMEIRGEATRAESYLNRPSDFVRMRLIGNPGINAHKINDNIKWLSFNTPPHHSQIRVN